MGKLFILIVILVIVLYCWKNRLVIRIDTIFRKGFKRIKDTYGVYSWCRQTAAIGKTLSVLDWLLEKVKTTNKKIITNVKSFYESHKDICIYEKSFYTIIKKFEDGTYTRDYIIFYDELFTMLEKGKLNKNILSFISQLRKRGIYLVTTVQEWLEINVTFRRYCRFYVDCKMYDFFGCTWSVNSIHNGYEMKWNNLENEYESPIIKTTIKKCSKVIADSYDTNEVIDTDSEIENTNEYSKKNYYKRA